MSRLEKSVVAVVVLLALIALVDYALSPGSSRVESVLRTVRDAAANQYERLSGGAPVAEEEAPAAAAPPPAAPARATPTRAPAPSPAAGPAVPAVAANQPTPSPASVEPPPPAPAPVPAATTRQAYYLPGNAATWETFELPFVSPIVIRAGGRIEAGTDVSGPAGIRSSAFEQDLQLRGGESRRVLPGEPYLALIGRVCSPRGCTTPLVIGTERVLCPSQIGTTGTLQIWTNNYERVVGEQTSLQFARVSGGYSFYVEPVDTSRCTTPSDQPAGLVSSSDAGTLEAGGTLRSPEFVISSSQSSWKPFFVPLAAPLRIRATGSMQPTGTAEATDPNGIVVPNVPSWNYPGQRSIMVDADNRLFAPSLPYQALIGRLCGQAGCGEPFLVGAERIVCPTPSHNRRLELWVNHIRKREGLLASQMPMTFDTFDLQQRRGAYRFELTRAPDDACAP